MAWATKVMFTRTVLVLLLLGTVFHVTGFVTPGWFFMKVNHDKVHVGLWYGVICGNVSCECDTVNNLDPSYFDFKDSETLSSVLSKYRILATVAVSACFFAVLTNVVHRKTAHKLTSVWAVAICIICIFLSGILGIVTSAHFGNRIQTAENYYASKNKENPYGVPYSIIFTGLGGAVSLINYTIVAYNIAMARNRK